MKNFKLILPGLLIMAFSLSAFSQHLDNVNYNKSNRYVQNELYNTDMQQIITFNTKKGSSIVQMSDEFAEIEINALYNAKANSYLAILSIIQNGKTAVAVDSVVNIRYNGFRNDLSEYGVKKEDIFLDMISLVPVFEMQVDKKLFSKTYNEVPVGFKLQKNIHIYFEKGDVLDRILTVAAKHEIYDLVKVEYFVNNTEAIYDSLVDVSINALNKKVKKLEKLGIVLDTLKHVYLDQKSVYFPVDRYKAYQSYGGISLTNGKAGATINSQKTPTMFYNKLPYHRYDIIINPAFREPAVQYSYNIRIRYYLKPEQKDQPKEKEVFKNIYHIVTPNGDVKKLNTN